MAGGWSATGSPMFQKSVHPLDLLLAVLAAALPGGAILYWLAIKGRLPFDFVTGLAGLIFAAIVMLAVIGGLVRFALWYFSPQK
jgi:hypothetical protein